MYALFKNTYYDHPGERDVVRVSAVKANLEASVEGDELPLLTGNAERNAIAGLESHYSIDEIEEI